MQQLPEALLPLAQYRQFIVWFPVWDEQKQKYHKRPRNPATGYDHSPTDPAIWMDAETAIATVNANPGHGLGFVFTKDDPFWFLDIDKCATPEGQWSDLAQQLMAMFTGAAVEISYSGQGLHIFGTGQAPEHGCKNNPLGLEFYTEDRFVALTGEGAIGSAATDHSATLAASIPFYFPPKAHNEADWTDSPHPDWNGPEDDEELVKRMLASKPAGSVFGGNKASVADLWTCDVEKLAAAYPDTFGNGRSYDGSSADQALCNHLAFWTGGDCERMDRLYRASSLYRDKWERQDYRENTILGAVSQCSNYYNQKPAKQQERTFTQEDSVAPASTTLSASAQVQFRDGLQFLAPSHQAELFKGCVYIRDIHRAFTPDGSLLKPEQFRATYGGYLFAMDATNDKTSRNAWEVFTESQAIFFPKAHLPAFRPEIESGALIEEDGRVLVNTYIPIPVPSAPGDVSPFLNHLALLFPCETDREIILSYMAACVQYKGQKFAWAPMIQGIEGNGKSLLIHVLTHAVGSRYTHKPNAQELGSGGSKFTAWLQNKLFIGVEEIYVSDRREVSDALKPLITDDRVEIQGKGADQVMGDNRANFILCSNHKDAILKNRGDRRYAVFYTAQQSPEDLHKAGMTLADGETPTKYFPTLYGWLKNQGGFANVTNYLENYQIAEEFNPATLCVRSPRTSSTEEAIEQSRGGIEQEIQEAIYQGKPGFAGGWVSSLALDVLLTGLNAARRIPRNKRSELMHELGFVPHPHLPKGRVNVSVPIDNGKPRLYVKPGSIQANMTGASSIVDAYVKAQGTATGAVGETAEVFNK